MSDTNAARARPNQMEADQTETIQAQAGPSEEPRFRIFVIDTGWNRVASRLLQQNLAFLRDLNNEDPLFLVDREASFDLLRKYSSLIGRDPIISVHDLRAIHKHAVHRVHGFRMHLGLLHKERQVRTALQMFARFYLANRAAQNLDKEVRKKLRREGLAGVIEVVGGAEFKQLVEE